MPARRARGQGAGRLSPERLRELLTYAAVARSGDEARAVLTVTSPIDGSHLADVPRGRPADVVAAIAAARGVQPAWADVPVGAPADVLRRVKGILLDERDGILDLVQAETGKARVRALEELLDAVVIKPDSRTPLTALAMAEVLDRAGLPRGLYTVVPGAELGTPLIDGIDHLMFTGSTASVTSTRPWPGPTTRPTASTPAPGPPPRRGRRVAARLQVGSVNVNEGYTAAWGSHDAPIGGMTESGLGRRHGAEGLLAYTEPQTTATQRLLPLGPLPHVEHELWGRWMARGVRAMPGCVRCRPGSSTGSPTSSASTG